MVILWSDLGGFELVKEKSFNTEGTETTEGHREELRSEVRETRNSARVLAGFVRTDFGMELHASDFVGRDGRPMMMPSSVRR